MFIRIKSIQTRDCHYPIYHAHALRNHANGYYFYDEDEAELEDGQGEYGQGYFGPYQTLDAVCKAQNRHWNSIQSL